MISFDKGVMKYLRKEVKKLKAKHQDTTTNINFQGKFFVKKMGKHIGERLQEGRSFGNVLYIKNTA